jgi:broad specificity phosphatase PhoE
LTDNTSVINADLTEKGYQDAFDFGHKIGKVFRIEQIFSSPVQRCIHSAESILKGADITLPIRSHWWLYSPFLNGNHPEAEAVNIAPTGTMKDSIISSIDKRALAMVLEHIKIPTGAGKMNLYISHDSLVTPLYAYLNGADTVLVEQYPSYLEGIALFKENGRWVMIY